MEISKRTIEPLSRMEHICVRRIQSNKQYQEREIDPPLRRRIRAYNFEKTEDGVENMNRDIPPCAESSAESVCVGDETPEGNGNDYCCRGR